MVTRLRRTAVLLASLTMLSVGAPATSAVVGHLSDSDAVSASSAANLRPGTGYAFSTTLQGQPVRWNPCAPIHWQYRRAGQVAGGFTSVVRAVARIAQATGTTWIYDGAVSTVPTTALLPRTSSAHPPVLIGWTTAAHSDLLRGQSANVLGVTRTTWFGLTHNGRTSASLHGAVIALNQTKHLPLTGPVSWYTVTLHELGHAMGMAHAASSAELMYPMLQPGLRDLQQGDLIGLAKVGRGQGCLSV